MAPSAVVAGAPAVGKSSVIRRICAEGEEGREQPGQPEHRAVQGEGRREDEARGPVWSVDTKYYTAQVRLCELQVPLGPGPARAETQGPCAPPEEQALDWSSCEALVLVFDLADHSSFLALQAWWSSVAEALAAAEALDVQLCVGNKADSLPHHPAQAALPPGSWEGAQGALEEQRRGYLEWCLDRGFEYVEASALDAGFDAGIGPAEGDSANSQGIARLRAALQAHMWSGMVLKGPGVDRTTIPGNPGARDSRDSEMPRAEDEGGTCGAGGDLSSDEEEGGPAENGEELTAEELGSFLGYVQLGDGPQEEAALQQGPGREEEAPLQHGPEHPSSSGASQEHGGGPQHEPPEWGPYQSMASDKPGPTPGLEDGGEQEGGRSEERVAQQEVDAQAYAAHDAPASGSPAVGLQDGPAAPGLGAGPSRGLAELAEDAEEGQLQSLEQLLGRVAAVREQGASLPDAARREMAAATALRLATLLCGKGDDDDDDDEDDEEDEDDARK